MPNWVINKLTITGPQEDRYELERLVRDMDNDRIFSLNKIIPMPESISKVDLSTGTDLCTCLLATEEDWKIIDSSEMSMDSNMVISNSASVQKTCKRLLGENYPADGITSREQCLALMQLHCPILVVQGQQRLNNLRTYGTSNWYDWSIRNWGTKWDVQFSECSFLRSDAGLEYIFNTAWSQPDPVIAKLAETFPTLEITHKYFDGGSNFWGSSHYITKDGKVECTDRDSLDEDRASLHLELYGYSEYEDATDGSVDPCDSGPTLESKMSELFGTSQTQESNNSDKV